ncbi:MAG TPA: molybdopterin molybdenumtransferase MoeA, partial [Cellvibrio sp.]|nr:molybdopterin molybdenumtransferase MoeA [Cellvibrio sp.]
NGDAQVATTGNQSSGVLSSVALANCYIVLEQERGAVTAGEKVNVVMFDRFLQ